MTAQRQASVSGVGMTELSNASGKSTRALAVECCTAALEDAGLEANDVDAILTYRLNDSAPVQRVLSELGMTRIGWFNEYAGGGSYSASALGDAARLIANGEAETVLIYRALNGRSGRRLGAVTLDDPDDPDAEFTWPTGIRGPVNLFALACRRWMHATGTGSEDLAKVVIHSRRMALDNPRAVRHESFTRDDYFDSPMISSPLRRVDCCQESDGAVALVVTSLERAKDLRTTPVNVRAVVRGGGAGAADPSVADDPSALFTAYLMPRLWERSGMSIRDVDVALLYDAYSFVVLMQMADIGFGAARDCAELLAGAPHLPVVNPHGGLMSEGYVHGLNNVAEAVRQLRGDGVNQVRDAKVALCTAFGGSLGSAAILTRSES